MTAAEIADHKQDLLLWERALHISTRIEAADNKDYALNAIVWSVLQIAIGKRDIALWARAYQVAQMIKRPTANERALDDIASVLHLVIDGPNAPMLWTKAIELVEESIIDSAQKAISLSHIVRNGAIAYTVFNLFAVPAAYYCPEPEQMRSLVARAREIVDGIKDPDTKKRALLRIVDDERIVVTAPKIPVIARPFLLSLGGSMQLNQSAFFLEQMVNTVGSASSFFYTYLQKWLEVANQIDEPHAKADAMSTIVTQLTRIARYRKDMALMEHARQIAAEISDSSTRAGALGQVAATMAQIAGARTDTVIWGNALQIASQITEPDTERFRQGIISSVSVNEATLSSEPSWSNETSKDDALYEIAVAGARIAEVKQDRIFWVQVLSIADGITDSSRRDLALSTMSASASKIAQAKPDMSFLEDALLVAERITKPSYKSRALIEISSAAAGVGNWLQARRIAALTVTDTDRAEALARILSAWAERMNPTLKSAKDAEGAQYIQFFGPWEQEVVLPPLTIRRPIRIDRAGGVRNEDDISYGVIPIRPPPLLPQR